MKEIVELPNTPNSINAAISNNLRNIDCHVQKYINI